MAKRICLGVLCLLLLAACGGAHSGSSSSVSGNSGNSGQQQAGVGGAKSPGPTTTSSTASPVSAPGCGQYCQQAGMPAGSSAPGYPCPSAGCEKCPTQNCVSMDSSGGAATHGVVTAQLTCNLPTACQGVFLLCGTSSLCSSGNTDNSGLGGRLAGSDFDVPAGTTSKVGIALTSLGQEVASGPGYSADVLIDMLNYGLVVPIPGQSQTFNLTTTDPQTFPQGATTSCGAVRYQGSSPYPPYYPVFVGPNTSCPFADNVVQAYEQSMYNNDSGSVVAQSPVTGQTYTMQCSQSSPIVCTGGTGAVVEFYKI
jgi:hypothetical protein